MELLLPISLIVIGLLLLIAEVKLLPGFNVAGIAGLLCIVFAIGYSFSENGVAGGIGMLVGSVLVGGGLFYWMWQSGAWDRFVLAANLQGGDRAAEAEDRARYLGKSGVALTPLRPTGVAMIDGERIEVVTEGDFIAAGSSVRVVAMDRRRYFVRLAAVTTTGTTSATVAE